MSTYVYNMDKAAKRLEESDGSDDENQWQVAKRSEKIHQKPTAVVEISM